MKELGWKCFTELAKHKPDGKQRVLVQDTVNVLGEFVESKSSICTEPTIPYIMRAPPPAHLHS